MAKGNTWSQGVLKMIFQAVAMANVMNNATSSPLTNLYVSLHTANPGAAGAQNTSEATYGSYARVAVVRTSSGWAISGQTVTPVSNISFPTALSGSNTITHAGIGTLVSGAGVLLYSGALSASILVSAGITPVLSNTSTVTES